MYYFWLSVLLRDTSGERGKHISGNDYRQIWLYLLICYTHSRDLGAVKKQFFSKGRDCSQELTDHGF